MIDLHSHILHGIDDGASTLEDSLAMARAAVEEGVTSIVATPHHQNGKYNNDKQDILVEVDSLNKRLQEEGIALTVLPGQEVRLYGEILEDYEDGKLLPLNGSKYMFIEFPSNHVPRYAKQMLYDMQLKGLVPIIVHPERNSELMEHPEKLYEFVDRGALTQITASSVTGHFGKKIQEFTHQIIEANLAHIVASDAHNTTSRGFKMQQAYSEIETKYGMDMRYYFQENAEYVVSNQTVYREQPEQIKKKKRFWIF